jgi:hypothetical protein
MGNNRHIIQGKTGLIELPAICKNASEPFSRIVNIHGNTINCKFAMAIHAAKKNTL